jgi:hypothetical protein
MKLFPKILLRDQQLILECAHGYDHKVYNFNHLKCSCSKDAVWSYIESSYMKGTVIAKILNTNNINVYFIILTNVLMVF